jgi:hypothetical protein
MASVPAGIDYDDHDLVFCRPDGLPLRPDRVTVAFEGQVAGCATHGTARAR